MESRAILELTIRAADIMKSLGGLVNCPTITLARLQFAEVLPKIAELNKFLQSDLSKDKR